MPAMILPLILLAAFGLSMRAAGGLIDVDYRSLVSRADLVYDAPVARSEEGMPVGNGRMGSLVWTTPSALKFQVNRVDVFAANSKSNWNTSDTPYELASMRMIFPLAICASEVLGVDEELRPVWSEINENLAPAPDRSRRGSGGAYGAFVYNGPGWIEAIGPEPELKRRFLGFNRLGSFIDSAGSGGAQIFRNRLRLREGPGAIDAEHIGGLASGIHSTMLSSNADTPEGEPILQIFNSWPKDWDAAFKLLASGAFIISSAQLDGEIRFVEIQSKAGCECCLRNPWGESEVTIYRNGKKSEDIKGALLEFSTRKGENIVVIPSGKTPEQIAL